MHEIVTLQFGEYANYVGNHFWNIQQAYPSEEGEVAEPQVGARQAPNHTLLYRESETRGYGRTFTPRLLIYDLKENLGSLSSYSGISASSTQPPTDFQTQTHHEETWDQPAQLCAQEMIQSAPFIKRWESPDPDAPVHQPLEPDTHYWTDFSENFFHPRTFSPHFSTLAVNGGLNGFAEFQQGRDLFRYQLTQGELNEDNLRFFVEESDYLQGFQIIANANDGFAGYTAAYVEYLRDEFPKEPVLVFGAAHVAEASGTPSMAQLLSIQQFAAEECTYVPLQLPNEARLGQLGWRCPAGSKWNQTYVSSAFLAAAIDTITLPYRTGHASLHELCSRITDQGQFNTLGLHSTYPSPLPPLDDDWYTTCTNLSADTIQDLSVFANSRPPQGTSEDEAIQSLTVVRSHQLGASRLDTRMRTAMAIPMELPLPPSFPALFWTMRGGESMGLVGPTLPGLVTVESNTRQAKWFGQASRDVSVTLARRQGSHLAEDELRELREAMVEMEQRYATLG